MEPELRGARLTVVRSLFRATVCGLLLAACGEADHGSASPADEIRLVSQTGGGGQVADQATPLPDDAAVDRFVAGLDGTLADKLRAAVTESGGPDGTLYAQVVSIGCDAPHGASASVGRTVVIQAASVPSPKQECFAPVTTVAMMRVPARQ